MSLSFLGILKILGSLALFIYGMKIMSEGIQKVAGSSMRSFFRTMTKTPYLGVLTGFLVTALIQSSSATTVMTVSLVNAGMLSLLEATGVIMGANIGTTITGWLLATLGFSFKIFTFCLPMIAIAVPMILWKKGKIHFWGEVIIGFALLFLGLGELKESFPDITTSEPIINFLKPFVVPSLLNNIFFALVGLLITIVLQSSSVTMLLTLVMGSQGWFPFELGCAMVLGSNLGTTITAEFAALVGNIHAKRTARIHTFFNLFGFIWMILLIGPIAQGIGLLMVSLGFNNPITNPSSIPIGIAAFHSIFNILNTLALLVFIKYLALAATKSIPIKEAEENLRFSMVDLNLKTPELSIIELEKEIGRFTEVTSRMSGFIQDLLFSTSNEEEETKALQSRVKKYKKIISRFEKEMAHHIARFSQAELTERASVRLTTISNIGMGMERIGVIFHQMSKTIQFKHRERIWFNPEQRENLKQIFNLLDDGFLLVKQNLKNKGQGNDLKEKMLNLEKRIAERAFSLNTKEFDKIDQEDYNIQNILVYNMLSDGCEKIANSLVKITVSIERMK